MRFASKHLASVTLAAVALSPLVAAQDEPPQPEPPVPDPPVEEPAHQDPVTQDPDPGEPAPPPPAETTEPGTALAEAEPAPPVPERSAPPSFAAPFDLPAIEDSLRRIAHEYPEIAQLVEIGKSRGERPIHALVLSDSSITAANAKPGLLVVDYLDGTSSRGAEVGLALAWNLVATRGADPAVAELLRRATITIVPAADPDARAKDEAARSRAVRLERNFPATWLPRTVQPGGGDYPLSEPESLALARFLESSRETVALVVEGHDVPEPFTARGVVEEVERRLLTMQDMKFLEPADGEEFALQPMHDPRLGSLPAFAFESQGIYPVSLTRIRADSDLDRQILRAAGKLRALAEDLPRVRVEEVALERLGHGLWQLDLVVKNDGRLPTRGLLARHRHPEAEILLDRAGGTLVAAAQRDDAAVAYRVLTGRPVRVEGRVAVGNLDGGQSLGLRLIVEAESGVTLEVRGASPSAGAARLTRVLP